MTAPNTPRPPRKRPKLTLLQIFSLVILGGVILIVAHSRQWI